MTDHGAKVEMLQSMWENLRAYGQVLNLQRPVQDKMVVNFSFSVGHIVNQVVLQRHTI